MNYARRTKRAEKSVLSVFGLVAALSLVSSCKKTHATTTSGSSSASSSSGSGGSGGTTDAWKLLYDGTHDREPGAIAVLPTDIVVETASDTPGPLAKLSKLPFAGGALTDIATLAPLNANDPFGLVTDDTSLAFVATQSGNDELGIVPAAGGAPMDLIPPSAMKLAHPLVAVHAGRVYFVDNAGVESIAAGGAVTPFVAMPVSAAAASESHVFFLSGSAVSAAPFGGGPVVHVADEASPVIAMAATGTHVYWLEDAGDSKHSTVFGAEIGGAGSKSLGTGEFHAIAADSKTVYAFFFDGDERAVLDRIDPASGSTVSVDSPFSSIASIVVRDDVPFVVALGTVLTQDAPNVWSYHREVRVLPK